MTVDPHDVEIVRAYRDVFVNNRDNGKIVLGDILRELGFFDTVVQKEGVSPEAQLAMQCVAKTILDKLGVFRYNNVEGLLEALTEGPPRFYTVPGDSDYEEDLDA